MPSAEFRELLNQFCIAMRDCRAVYLNGAKVVIEDHVSLLDQPPSMFLETMDELHRGLLIKMLINICGFNHVFTRTEEMMAQMLILHIWHQDVSPDQVRRSIDHFRRHADTLQWTSLVRPFKTIEPLRPLVPNLETCVMRIGNLMAKADGKVTMLEIDELKSIQREIMTFLTVDAGSKRDTLSSNHAASEELQYAHAEAQKLTSSDIHAQFAGDDNQAEGSLLMVIGTDAHGNDVYGTVDFDEVEQGGSRDEPDSGHATDAATGHATGVAKASNRADSEPDSIADHRNKQVAIDRAMSELQQLTGLASIKGEIRSITNLLKVQAMRREKGLPETRVSLHLVFEGNPGTGKTTVARIVGRILGALGVLERGHVVECDRSGLVAEFAGQTGPKANKLIDSALDGILFIDEAYSLINEGSGGDPYGNEAVQTLLKRMEDDRDRLVVIMAGYPDEMEQLLKANPGLSSRFGRRLVFEDYLPRELGQIFGLMCDQNHYRIESETQAKVIKGLTWEYEQRDRHFGNGRFVRNAFEHAIRHLANRVVDELAVTEELLTKFQPADIRFDQVPDGILAAEHLQNAEFRIHCDECESSARVRTRTLGKRVTCRKCKVKFVAQWGSLVEEA